jgi:FkbM family methyltransferase
MSIVPGDTSEWVKIDGNNTLRLLYSLNSESIVVDIGARAGDWASPIRTKFGCEVHCFEPIKEFCDTLIELGFKTYNYTVLDYKGKATLGVNNGEASVFHKNPDDKVVLTDCIAAWQIFDIIGHIKIDLLKINVEGAEYCILNNLHLHDKIKDINEIQVQFHTLKNYNLAYDWIRDDLGITHELTWRYPFVWENWKLKHL